jgi:hypothetical protein
MNRRFTIFYKTFSGIRLAGALIIIGIILYEFITSPPRQTNGPGFDFFTVWEEIAIISFLIAYPLNSIINALIAFKPRWTLPGIFDWKPLFILTFIVELYSVPWFLINAWEQVQDAFFPPPPDTYLDSILSFMKTDTDHSEEKWTAVWISLLVISSLLFIVFFWKVFRASNRSIQDTNS